MKDDMRYTTSDCFETFPFPLQYEAEPGIDISGANYLESRQSIMQKSRLGLTKTYNRFHDPHEKSPEIAHLRELHAAMDRAVLWAYCWDDLAESARCEFLLDYEEDSDRPYGDTTQSVILIAKFQQRFREIQWSENIHLPEMFYDPRPLAAEEEGRSACLHAKFVISDSQQVFISSANFTEAAQQRNIEAGILSESPALARDIESHFQSLVDHGFLRR